MASIRKAADELPDRFNLAEWLVARHVKRGRGDRTAVVTDGARWNYAALNGAVLRWASAFRDAGVGPGDRVALLAPDGPELLAAFLGTLAAGGVAVPLNTRLEPGSVEYVLRDCRPRLLVWDRSLGSAPGPDGEPPGAAAARRCWTLSGARARAADAAPMGSYAPSHRDGSAFLLYTSGTTGRPKGVVHLHHDGWVCCRTYGEAVLETGPEDRAFSVAKIFFAYGLGNSVYFPLAAGASTVLFGGRPMPEAIFDQVERHRPTLFFGVPTSYAQMLEAMEAGASPDFSSVRRCVSAGEALPPDLYRRWRERTGLEILDGIGTTELCHIFLSNRPGEVVPGSSGTAVPGYEVRLLDEEGDEVPDGEVGDLEVRGDSTMALYRHRHEETKEVLEGEWIRTGDKYRRDPETGAYRHAGRSDDMLKVGGVWVSPVEVEACLMDHPAVGECAVVGAEDEEGLVKPVAYVVPRGDPPADPRAAAEELQDFVKERLAPFKYPRAVHFRESLPKTATGKIRRFRLREK